MLSGVGLGNCFALEFMVSKMNNDANSLIVWILRLDLCQVLRIAASKNLSKSGIVSNL